MAWARLFDRAVYGAAARPLCRVNQVVASKLEGQLDSLGQAPSVISLQGGDQLLRRPRPAGSPSDAGCKLAASLGGCVDDGECIGDGRGESGRTRAESARVQAALDEVDARRGPGAPSLAAADRAAKSARDAFFDAIVHASAFDAGDAALALAEARRARDSILDGLTAEDWGILVAAGYRMVDEWDGE